MAKWKYGSYVFKINPNSFSNQIEVVGDEVRTLTGALISQPTGTKETYEVESVFFQPRTRVISETALNVECIDYVNSKLYAINKTNDRIDVYNSNMVVQSNVSLSLVTNKNFAGISVASDGIHVLSSTAGVSDTIYKINLTTGAIISTTTIPITNSTHITSIKLLSGYMYALRGTKIEKRNLPALVKETEITTPLAVNGNRGLTTDGEFLVFGGNDGTYGVNIYHLDVTTGKVISAISNDSFLEITDLAFNDTEFFLFNKTGNKIQKIDGNTVLVDIYRLEKEIKTLGYTNMVDDMGVSRRVVVASINKERKLDYEHMHSVSLSIEKVDRG